MIRAVQPRSTDDHFIRLNVSWMAYEVLTASLGDDSHVRLTYDGETLEIMSPGSAHEFLANLLADMLASLRLEWAVPLTNLGSTTFKAEPVGFEADKTYYLDAKARLRDVNDIDLAIDPPPDLLVEIDISSSSSRKLETTYLRLSVPEVWRYDRAGFSAYALDGDRYVRIDTSRSIAGLPVVEIARRLENSTFAEDDILSFLVEWQTWLRSHVHLHAGSKRRPDR